MTIYLSRRCCQELKGKSVKSTLSLRRSDEPELPSDKLPEHADGVGPVPGLDDGRLEDDLADGVVVVEQVGEDESVADQLDHGHDGPGHCDAQHNDLSEAVLIRVMV